MDAMSKSIDFFTMFGDPEFTRVELPDSSLDPPKLDPLPEDAGLSALDLQIWGRSGRQEWPSKAILVNRGLMYPRFTKSKTVRYPVIVNSQPG